MEVNEKQYEIICELQEVLRRLDRGAEAGKG